MRRGKEGAWKKKIRNGRKEGEQRGEGKEAGRKDRKRTTGLREEENKREG